MLEDVFTSGGVYVTCVYLEDLPLVEFMYLVFACQVQVVGDLGLCCGVRVMPAERY